MQMIFLLIPTFLVEHILCHDFLTNMQATITNNVQFQMEKFEWELTIKRNILMLKMVGLWPEGNEYKLNLYRLYSVAIIIIFIYGHNFFQVINLYFIMNDLELVTATIFVALTDILAILKSYSIIKNMATLKQLMATLNSKGFQPRNTKQQAMVQPSLKFWQTVYVAYWSTTYSTIFFWSTFPILDKSVKDYRLPFLAWYPYNTKISPLYEITYIYQIVSVILIATINLHVDTLIAAFMMYVGAQCDILCDDLRNLRVFAEDESTTIEEKFVHCIEHHKEILSFAINSNNFFNMIIISQFFTSSISTAMTMFQLTVVVPFSSEFYSFFFYGLAIIVETFMYCWFGNEVEIKSSNVPYASFEADWTGTSLGFQKSLIIFSARTQTPIKMSALNLFYLSLQTFMTILRTSWSYCAVLRQVNAPE